MIRRHPHFLSLVLVVAALLSSCGDSGPATSNSPSSVALVPAAGSIALVAGGLGGVGNRDANGTDARFNQPLGLAIAADGTRYVADNGNHTIRKISASGDVTTVAGEAGVPGSSDGVGSAAHFRSPAGIAVAGDGTLYVADSGNYVLRQIAPDGTVSTLAGLAGSQGATDGSGAAARFSSFYQVVLASDGNLYVPDTGNNIIRRVTLAGDVTTIAGQAGSLGMVDDSGALARFNVPIGIANAGPGLLYIADAGNNRIRQMTLAGDVSTVAGGSNSGWIDGDALSARFNYPAAVAVAADGSIYVSDVLNYVIRRISPAGQVSTLAGLATVTGWADGNGTTARFSFTAGMAVDPSGGGVWVLDSTNHSLRYVSDAGDVTTTAGLPSRTGTVNASGALARFGNSGAVSAGQDGAIYLADTANHVIRKIDSGGTVTTLAGQAGSFGSTDGAGSAARFNSPLGIAVGSDGTVYVADTGNSVIRKVTPAGVVTTLAGGVGVTGSEDGAGTAARFSFPRAVAVDLAGNVYVADTSNNAVRKVTPGGVVTTLAGAAGNPGSADGTGSAARFYVPQGIAVDVDGNLYVADSGNHSVRKVTATGVVTTLAGGGGAAGSADGTGSAARFRYPIGIAVDAAYNVYVSDRDNHLLRMVTPAGVVTTLAGVAGSSGVVTGALPGGLNQPVGMTIGNDGALYVTSENSLLKVTLPVPAPMFYVGLQAASSSIFLGQGVNLRWAATDAINCVATGDWSGAQASTGSATVTPSSTGTKTYTLSCDEDGGTATGSATVTVMVGDPPPMVSLSASATPIAAGSPVTLTWSTSGTTTCTASGDWSGSRGTSGSEVLTPAEGTHSYTLACTGPGGSQSQTVTVRVMGTPTASLTGSTATLTLGQSLTLNWTSTNALSCSASGAWAGLRAYTGASTLTPGGTGTYQYDITCTGPAGSATDSVSVVVSPAATAAPSGGGGGGALGLEGLAPLALLAALKRRRRRAA